MGSPLVTIAASKRSRTTLMAVIFAVFVVFSISRLPEPGALLFGRPIPVPDQQQTPGELDRPRFALFGIPDFAADVEATTLNIRVREEDATPQIASIQGSPAFAHGHKPPKTRQERDQGDDSPSPHQRQLPIALPKLTRHDLADPSFNLSDLDAPVPGMPQASITLSFPAANNIDSKKAPPDASKMVFGVATTLGRSPENLRNFQHWAAGTGARFLVVHEPWREGEPSPDEVTALFQDAGIENLTLVEKDKGWGERFVGMLADLHDHMEAETEWAVLMDDDTFFFDMETVVGMLARYDTKAPWYVGALSDNKWNINNGGLYAVGGAGVFLSRPLLESMRPHADTCFPAEGTAEGGDALLGACIHRHTTTKLSLEHGLHQLDLHGDATGFYEAARSQPVSVHHWKSWHHHDVPAVATVSRACGRACVLQNFRFQDGWQMSNGFSIVRYGYDEKELAAQHPEAMEHTWKLTAWDIEDSWEYSLAPLKERDARKVQFLMERIVVGKDGTVTVYYVRREDGVGRGLIRVVWR